MSSRMAPSPIPMTDDNRRQLELWCNTLNRKLMENPIEDISNYALMALLREKYDPGRVIDALLEGMCTLCFDIFFSLFHFISLSFIPIFPKYDTFNTENSGKISENILKISDTREKDLCVCFVDELMCLSVCFLAIYSSHSIHLKCLIFFPFKNLSLN